MSGAIQLIVDAAGPASANARLLLAGIGSAFAVQPAVSVRQVSSAGGQKDETLDQAAIQRKVSHLLLVYVLA